MKRPHLSQPPRLTTTSFSAPPLRLWKLGAVSLFLFSATARLAMAQSCDFEFRGFEVLWNGAADNGQWSDGGNWGNWWSSLDNDNGQPLPTTSPLIFAEENVSVNPDTTHDLPAGTAYSAITWVTEAAEWPGVGPFNWNVGGNNFDVTGRLISIGGERGQVNIQPRVTLLEGADVQAHCWSNFRFEGGLVLSGTGVHDFLIDDDGITSVPRTGIIDIPGVVSGSAPLWFKGNSGFDPLGSRMILSAANTFTGELTVGAPGQCARLQVVNNASLGSSAGRTVINPDGWLELKRAQAMTIAEPMAGEGTIVCNGGGATLSGAVESTGAGLTLELNAPLTLAGPVSGTGMLEVTGAALLTIGGTGANTLSGNLRATGTSIELKKTPGITALSSDTFLYQGADLRWVFNNQVADTASITTEGGFLDLNGHQETLSEIHMRGDEPRVELGASGVLRVNGGFDVRGTGVLPAGIQGGGLLGELQVGADNVLITVQEGDTLEISTQIVPAVAGASFLKTEVGTLRFTGTAGCSVPLTILSGTVFANRPGSSSSLPVTLDSGGTLSGTGRVGPVSGGTNGGFIDPGAAENTPGILTCGNLTLSSTCDYIPDLRGSVLGTGYDQLFALGTVNLGGAALQVDITGYNPPAGTSFTILQNDGTDAITGTFAGLAQGALLPGGRFTISYTGGSGNDVVLVAVVQPTGVTRTWTGLSSQFFNNASNWSPSGVPQNGDALVFPPNPPVLRTPIINDLSGRAFQAITLNAAGPQYAITGNSIGLAAGIQVTGVGGTPHIIGMSLALTGPQTISTGAGPLSLDDIDTNGMPVTFQTIPAIAGLTPVITCNGVISEGGGDLITKTGTGVLVLGGDNTTRANIRVAAGELRITHVRALGSASGATTVDAGAMLTIAGSTLETFEPINLAGVLNVADNAGTPSLGSTVALNAAATAEIRVSATGVDQLNLFSDVTGTAIRKTGPGTLTFVGARPKVLSAGMVVAEGRLRHQGGQLPGPITVGADITSAELELLIGNTVPHRLVINTGSVANMVSSSVVVGELTLHSGAVIGSRWKLAGPLHVLASDFESEIASNVEIAPGINVWDVENGAAPVDLIVSGNITEPTGTETTLIKTGPGRLDCTGNNFSQTNEGSRPDHFLITDGHCVWSGFTPTMTVELAGGTLGGTHTVSSVTAAPGTVIAPGTSPGLMKVSSLDMSDGGTLAVELNGTAAGTGYDQIICTGAGSTVDLSGATLSVSAGFVPPAGHIFTVIDVQGTGAVVPFPALAEASIITSNSRSFVLSYTGGDGNNVTLRYLPQATGITKLWDGGGADSNWSTAANWSGNTLPQPGDALLFNNTAPVSRRVMVQDIANAWFQKVTLEGSAVYTLNGTQPLSIVKHFEDAHSGSATATVINVPVIMEGEGLVFETKSTGNLTLNGDLSFGNSAPVILSTGALVELAGVIRGTGKLSIAGNVSFSGSTANECTGSLTLGGGSLMLRKAGTALAIPGPVEVTGGTLLTSGGTNQLNDAYLVTVSGTGSYRPGAGERIGGLRLKSGGTMDTGTSLSTITGPVIVEASSATATLAGRVSLGGAQCIWSVADGAAAVDLNCSALISGPAGSEVLQQHIGTIVYSGNNTVPRITILSGIARMTGASTSNVVPMTANAFLEGNGTVGSVNDPAAAGTIRQSAAHAVLSVTGDVLLGPSGKGHYRIGGLTRGTQHDGLNCGGNVNIASLTVELTGGFVPPGNHEFLLLNKTSAGAILPQPVLFLGCSLQGGIMICFSRSGGDGNDFTASRQDPILTGSTILINPATGSPGLRQQVSTGIPNQPMALRCSDDLTTWDIIATATTDANGNVEFWAPLDLPRAFFRVEFAP